MVFVTFLRPKKVSPQKVRVKFNVVELVLPEMAFDFFD